MDTTTLIDATERNGIRLLEAAAKNLDAQIPACRDWTARDLVIHTAQVHGWMTAAIEADSTERPRHPFADAPADTDVIVWGRDVLDSLIAVLRRTDPQRDAWTWGHEQKVAFFSRRMAHETVVHRWDAEAAIGEITPIDSDLASDGVDELTQVGMQRSVNPKREFVYPAGSLHLHRTDGEGEWLLRNDGGRLVVTREHAKGDVAVRGAGPDLLLYLWGRAKENLEIFGDEALADAWAEVAP